MKFRKKDAIKKGLVRMRKNYGKWNYFCSVDCYTEFREVAKDD